MRTENHPYPSSERFLVRASLFLAVLALAANARGDPFYLRYDADEVYPEQAGWTRYGQDPAGAEKRSLDDGWLTLDTRASYSIFDLYYVRSPAFALQPGEELQVSWRMEVLETDLVGDWETDVTVLVTNSTGQYVQLILAPTYVAHTEYGMEKPDHCFSFQAGTSHSYLLTSTDMQKFRLEVDGTYAFSGVFLWEALVGAHWISFGDECIGARSLSTWDFVQVQVAPESGALLLSVSAGALFFFLRRRIVV